VTPKRHEGAAVGPRPPKVRVVVSVRRPDRPLSHAADPGRRNDLLAVPQALVKIE
jgi:hypothetical protein